CPANTDSVAGSDEVTDCKCNAGFTGNDGVACVACIAGTYKISSGNAVCTPCAAEKYSGVVGAVAESTCVNCPDNTFSSATAETTCSSCPINTFSSTGSGNVTDCRCNAGYTAGTDGMECTACIAGTYKTYTGWGDCSLCSVNTYATSIANPSYASCLSCPDNMESPPGSKECTGDYYCPGGTGTTECVEHTSSPPGSSGADNCICVGGYQGASGGPCTVCDAGTYCSSGDMSVWSWCHAGVKQSCPSLSNTPGTGAISVTDCKCNAGYTGPDGGHCLACASGSYKVSPGAAMCTGCVANTYSSAGGATSAGTCTSCPGNTWSASHSGMLADCTCVAGYTGSDGTACTACIAGTHKSLTGAGACTLCATGTFSS
ncbi:hypothetical protein T484DRAFT_1591497, partial [Baffinella frigidus]